MEGCIRERRVCRQGTALDLSANPNAYSALTLISHKLNTFASHTSKSFLPRILMVCAAIPSRCEALVSLHYLLESKGAFLLAE